ncbi:hypothetical protein FGB62_4g258 [Gracilaria domingensis]|nr:hypothetical protein FGB62_4g258 [Gracilaria domingensis]
MEIDHFPNQRSHVTKKRTVNSRNSAKREMKPSESSQETPAKRARNGVEKRPRAPSKPPVANGTAANNASGFRIPRSVPAPLPPPLRSAPASPTENGRQSAPKRSAPAARNSIASLSSRRFSPPSNTQLPKPVSRQTPTKTRQSPHSSSRGPSPNVHSPSSPRLSSRPKMDDPEDVRRHVVHSLALGDMTMAAIRRRHEAYNMEGTVLDGALGEVADKSGTNYRLKKRSWREVYDDYTDYSEMEKKRMVQNRFKAGSVDGKLGTEVMNHDMFEHEVKDVTKRMVKTVADVKDEEDEDKLRENYNQMHKLYKEAIERVTDVSIKFRRLEDKWVSCGDTETTQLTMQVSMALQSGNKVHGERFTRLQNLLPKMHGYLKQVRQAVVRYAQWEE